jgi:hypothetical protein
MRHIWPKLVFCLALTFFTASPADAQIWRVIWELSGPGKFQGLEWEWRLLCLTEPDRQQPQPGPGAAQGTADDKGEGLSAALGALGPGCLFQPVPLNRTRRASLNLSFAMLDANRNNLQYPPSNTLDHDVKLTVLEPTIWWRPAKTFEVGAGVGMMWFSGEAFNTFERLFFEPIRLDVRPLAIAMDLTGRGHAEWTEAFSFRAGVVVIPVGFRAEHFGAIRGTFRTAREVLPTFSLFLDVEPIIRYMRRR